MTIPSENFAPYVSIGNMLTIFKRIRNGWTPTQIDSGDLERIGITKSTVNRALAALEFLQLIDETGRTNDHTWKAIATATAEEYPKVLEGILRNSYSDIFELYPNPADATDVQIDNAFRRSEPLTQKSRMVSLFRGLCQEANVIAGEPLIRDQKPSPKAASKNESEKKAEPETPKDSFPFPEKINPALKWYKDLETLMSRLPKSNNVNERPKWTEAERERWLTALQSMLDLLIDVER